MTTTDTLIAKAVATYGFRQRGPFEGQKQYLAALIAYVEDRDLGMAHELRLGRPQVAWTDADVASFRRALFTKHRPPRDTPRPGTMDGLTILEAGNFNPTEATVLAIAHQALQAFTETRTTDPTRSLPIFANVLLMDGRLLITSVPRGDRVAILKTMSQQLPVFGYIILADVFIHGVPAEGHSGHATKRDALIAHVGTRDFSRMMVRPYTVNGGRAVFEDPPPADLDKRGSETIHDPYAGIFVSVPGSETPQ